MKKESVEQFSFLMVLIPILVEAFLDLLKLLKGEITSDLSVAAAAAGFCAAFVTGCLACQWMINIVKKGKLIWFAAYCVIIGILAIIFGLC